MNHKRILIRGGSIPAGHGVAFSYCDILAKAFSNVLDIINISNDGDTTFDAMWSYNNDIDKLRPDILLLHFGIDDAYHPVYRSEFKENLVQLVRLSRKRFNPIILLSTSHPFENIYEMDTLTIYYRTIREVAIDLQCGMISIHTFWMGLLNEFQKPISDYVQSDVRYPNEKGHELYAHIISSRFSRLLSNNK